MHLGKGAALLDIYSPDLLIAQSELIAARRALAAVPTGAPATLRASAERDFSSARDKLLLWDVDPADVDAISREEAPRRLVTFRSPVAGHLVGKFVVDGSHVEAGERLFRIVDHSRLWLDAHIFERQAPHVALDQKATARVHAFPGRIFEGPVILVHPHMDETTRTVMARIEVENPGYALKPGMYATVEIAVRLAEDAVVAPRTAVIDTGKRRIAYVARDAGRFDQRELELGLENDEGMVQVLAGLEPGEKVVTSAQFLIDAESRSREASMKLSEKGRYSAASPAPPAAGTGPSAPAAGGPAAATVAAADASLRARLRPHVDALVASYLAITSALAADDASGAARAVPPLREAAHKVSEAARGSTLEEGTRKLHDAAFRLDPGTSEAKRPGLRALSDAMIALVRAVPPSPAAGAKLFVFHCSMAPGSWLQTTDTAANPYYGAEMLRCGEVVTSLDTEGER
jgi:hypothetical protein